MAAISQGWLVKGEAKEKNLFLKLFETVFSVVMNIFSVQPLTSLSVILGCVGVNRVSSVQVCTLSV